MMKPLTIKEIVAKTGVNEFAVRNNTKKLLKALPARERIFGVAIACRRLTLPAHRDAVSVDYSVFALFGKISEGARLDLKSDTAIH